MTFPVLIEQCNGEFSAELAGAPGVRVVEPSRSQAIAGLKAEIAKCIQLGKLAPLEIDTVSVSALAGAYRDDPALRKICDEAYRTRDAERGQ